MGTFGVGSLLHLGPKISKLPFSIFFTFFISFLIFFLIFFLFLFVPIPPSILSSGLLSIHSILPFLPGFLISVAPLSLILVAFGPGVKMPPPPPPPTASCRQAMSRARRHPASGHDPPHRDLPPLRDGGARGVAATSTSTRHRSSSFPYPASYPARPCSSSSVALR